MSDNNVKVLDQHIGTLLDAVDHNKVSERQWLEARYEHGLGWVHLPEGRGGLGLPPNLQKHLERRLAETGAPNDPGARFFGIVMAGPTIAMHGSDEVVERLLRDTYTGAQVWCQLFSEPGAGSDLAGLSTKAVRDGDEWVITGQKVWNTLAHIADRAMLVARTDPDSPKHKGITYFALDMHAPGVEVRPLRQITGEAEFNEVYMTEVRVPDADRIGDVGEGWRVAMTTLMNERVGIAALGGGGDRAAPKPGTGPIARCLDLYRERGGSSAARERLMQLYNRSEALRLTGIRAGQMAKAGTPGPEGSVAKLMMAELNKKIFELALELMGPDGLVGYRYEMGRELAQGFDGPPRKMFLRTRANSIEGGTSEIMRNILGERVLGLPGEPRVDKDMPWSAVPRS
ncbi:MAG TPA: acyl-CoA dehydrogenase family protein [Acidimicrobiales bacterium]|jgi:alkylation response protein AidB-like acyl-CoA dehydrogenase